MFFLSRVNFFLVIIGLAAYCGLHYFVYYSFIRFFDVRNKSFKRIVFSFVAFAGSCLFLDSILPHDLNNSFARAFSFLFGAWLSILPILMLSIIFLWIIRRAYGMGKFHFLFLPVSYVFFIAPFLIIGIGLWQSFAIVVKEVSIPVKNLPAYWKDKTIVQISDLHLRDVSQMDFLEQAVEKIQNISPELVVITGDLFDSSADNKQNLLSPFKKISVPVLFATGNHDRNLADLEINHITLLDDKLFEKEGLQIIGLGYPGHGDTKDPAEILKNKIVYDKKKPTILLYHTPTTVEVAKQGDRYISPNTDFSFVKNLAIDLQLSGHTHGGQFFPFTLIADVIYKGYEKGLHRDGNFSLFVSPGLGTWGPPVRIFMPPEIDVIRLEDFNSI